MCVLEKGAQRKFFVTYVIQSMSKRDAWKELVERIESLFGVQLEKPRYIQERGEIVMGF